MLQAHGVEIATLVDLVRDGFATAPVKRLGVPAIEVTRLRITDKGREAIEA